MNKLETQQIFDFEISPQRLQKKQCVTYRNNSNADHKLLSILKELSYGFWDFKGYNNQSLTHGMHTYPATMIYPISRNILSIVQSFKTINSLADPFAGSGTVLVEGILSNIKNVYGSDINPLSELICKVKTTPMKSNELEKELDVFIKLLNDTFQSYYNKILMIDNYITNKTNLDITSKDGWGTDAPEILGEILKHHNLNLNVPSFKNLGYWFTPKVILELVVIKETISTISHTNIRDFVLLSFSETIRIVSNRRNGEFKMFRIPKEKLIIYNPDVKEVFLKILKRNLIMIEEFSNEYYSKGITSNVHFSIADARKLPNIKDDELDLVITSPPYGDSKTTVAYGEFSRLSLQWLGITQKGSNNLFNIDKEMLGGNKTNNNYKNSLPSKTLNNLLDKISERDTKRADDVLRFYNDLNKVIFKLSQKSKKGAYHFWVVGNRTVKNIRLSTDIIIRDLAQYNNLEHVCSIQRNISNKFMPSLNAPSNIVGATESTMTNENIIVLRKK